MYQTLIIPFHTISDDYDGQLTLFYCFDRDYKGAEKTMILITLLYWSYTSPVQSPFAKHIDVTRCLKLQISLLKCLYFFSIHSL